jgi:large subunit ribosomal protein L3
MTDKGEAIAVTVVDVSGNTRSIQVKTKSTERTSYSAIQLGYEDQLKESRVTKPLLGHFKKHSVARLAKRIIKEFRVAG